MTERSRTSQLWNAMVNSGNIVYNTGLTDTPASGAPGAYKVMLADATPTAPWWVCGFICGKLSGAGPTVFDYQLAKKQDGSLGDINSDIRISTEAGLAALQQHIHLSYPVRVATGVGAAARQITASGKTLDCTIFYAMGVGS